MSETPDRPDGAVPLYNENREQIGWIRIDDGSIFLSWDVAETIAADAPDDYSIYTERNTQGEN